MAVTRNWDNRSIAERMLWRLVYKRREREKGRGRVNEFAGEKLQTRQNARLADMSRQRLLGYAESFRELAKSFQEEQGAEQTAENKDRQSILEERKLWENRQLISSNLKDMASIMEQVATEELVYEPMEEKVQRILVHALRAEGIFAEHLCYLPGENACRTIGVILYTEKKGGVAAEEVADMLSVLLKSKLEAAVTCSYIVDSQKRSFIFVEQSRFLALTGISKAVKETETISGDNFSVLQSETGKKTILLSDGTGSGKRAHADSGRVLDLMEKMLEAGFDIGTAAGMVNTALFAKDEESNHPTLDICSIDLYNGSCEICKIGGAVSFIKRGQNVEKIQLGTLPLGIFQSLEVQPVYRELMDGDYIILMTDGVLDALEELECEEAMAEAIRNIPERNPQEMAEQLLQMVLKGCGGRIRDDMTIFVVGIWEN